MYQLGGVDKENELIEREKHNIQMFNVVENVKCCSAKSTRNGTSYNA